MTRSPWYTAAERLTEVLDVCAKRPSRRERLNEVLFSRFQAVGKPPSLTQSQRRGWPTPSQRRAARATWASAAVTGRSRAITIRRKAGSGEDAPPTSSMESSSHAASWTLARSKRPRDASWTYITMRQEERYTQLYFLFGGGSIGLKYF